ncbi:MAG: RNA polymerase sigma factor [Phycisphaerae bacterium]
MEQEQLRQTISQAQAGQAEAYRTLMEEYAPRLYGYFFRSTRSHHDAEDLLGEMMLRLVKNLKKYDDRGRFEPWLFRIAANMVRDRIRRKKTAPTRISLFKEEDEGLSLGDSLEANNKPVDHRMQLAEASVELQAALEKLDGTTREMILLRHFGQMSFKEIAGIFDCPLGTVLARVHRGVKSLRKIMGATDGA